MAGWSSSTDKGTKSICRGALMKRSKLVSSLCVLVAFSFLAPMLTGCATEPKTEKARDTLHDHVQSALGEFRQKDPTFDDFLSTSYGYVIFPTVGKGGLGAGGAYGHGEVYEQGRMVGYAT